VCACVSDGSVPSPVETTDSNLEVSSASGGQPKGQLVPSVEFSKDPPQENRASHHHVQIQVGLCHIGRSDQVAWLTCLPMAVEGRYINT